MPKDNKDTLKQGETKDITKKTDDEKDKDFKGTGVEGQKDTKDEDVVNENLALQEENAKLKAENSELKAKNSKDVEVEEKEKEYVTGEDAIKAMRAKGQKI